MSLISFIKKIITGISSLFNGLPEETKSAISIAITITENLKKAIDSPVADVLTTVIPGNADDALVAALRAALPQLLTELQLAENCINASNPNTIIQCSLQTLSRMTGDTRNSFLHSLSILLARAATGGKLIWNDGVYLLQWFYSERFKNQEAIL